ncbi:MAG: thioredoxin domain-containing protein, partial [Acidobacteria bacterium]|nr:thioredoxin domain-containing protein [Acidobacteriota bacterium]
ETASSSVLLVSIVAAVVWASVGSGYERFWEVPARISLGELQLEMSVREWVSRGLMTFFFLVVGVEARRQLDLGDLRRRDRLVIPVLAGVVAMAIPAMVFVLVNLGSDAATGWGVAMSTDTALALGLLTLVGRGAPERLRGFIVTVFIVDDLVALVVIALFYNSGVQAGPLAVAVLAFLLTLALRRWTTVPGTAYAVLGVVCWGGLLLGGVDPVVAGLALGLASPAYTPERRTLEQATGLFRQFREQPTSALARSASAGLIGAISPNDRLQDRFQGMTSFVIVPVFALANAGVRVGPPELVHALRSPVTIGIVLAYVLGKPVGVLLTSGLATAVSRGRIRPPVGWGAVAGSGTIAGVGFTVAVLIAALAFSARDLADAKVGILAAALASAVVTGVLFRVIHLLPSATRNLALNGRSVQTLDLSRPVDSARDHIRGSGTAVVTVVEYGDFQCPYCGRAEQGVRELRAEADVRFVWRHLPLGDVHPRAERAAQAAEAAAEQGTFWEMHDLLLANQADLGEEDLLAFADELGLDRQRFVRDLDDPAIAARIRADVESADASGVSGTPTFFLNGARHYGAYDFESLAAAAREARTVAVLRDRS